MRNICICDYDYGDIRYEFRTMLFAKLFCLIKGYRIMETGKDYIYAKIEETS